MKYKKISLILLLSVFVVITGVIFLKNYETETLVDAKWNEKEDALLAITIDGEEAESFPTTNSYKATVSCSSGTGSATWNGSKWLFSVSNITTSKTKCNVNFTYHMSWDSPGEGTLLAAIKRDNTIRTPVTTPGSDVSAHRLADLSSSTTTVTNKYTNNYAYASSWTANGTNFNLVSPTITNTSASAYQKIYSTLVGKYINSTIVFGNVLSGSTTVKTTDLDCVYYVVSATTSSITTKQLCSNKNTTEALMSSATDDYGTSYYYRGKITNNYVQYANMCWRIVRVTGDASIKLLLHNYNGLTDSNTTPSSSSPCTVTGTNLSLARFEGTNIYSNFNYSEADNAFVGLMYGNVGCSDKTSKTKTACETAGGTWTASTSYANAHANINKSTILQNLEKWYDNVLMKQTGINENQLADVIWCNDKKTSSGVGYGTNATTYSGANRLTTTKKPSFVCQNDNLGGKLSKMTVNDTSYGNGALDKKIGLLTLDEAIYAGAAALSANTVYYLRENASSSVFFLGTPYNFESSIARTGGYYGSGGVQGYYLTGGRPDGSPAYSIRPAIALNSNIKISGGTGTAANPYIISN